MLTLSRCMAPSNKRQSRYCGVILFILVITSCTWWHLGMNYDPRAVFQHTAQVHATQVQPAKGSAANRTLGFEKILAVSMGPSWRTVGLQAAAALTGLEISIPPQPRNPPELIQAFEQIGKTTNGKNLEHGAATAWFAHIDMLKFVIASGFSTAFIVEDDLDWDVEILSQMLLVSDNIRNFTNTPASDSDPFGSNWDVLWLGHCGERSDLEGPSMLYADSTRISVELYSGWSKKWWMNQIPDGYRRIQKAANTVCTFGYGVTSHSARKLLAALGHGADEAYDVAMQHQCVSGALSCLVVSPQLMHHHEHSKESGYVSLVHEGNGQGTSAADEAFRRDKGTTPNMVNSARCKALFDDTCLAAPTAPNFLDPA